MIEIVKMNVNMALKYLRAVLSTGVIFHGCTHII